MATAHLRVVLLMDISLLSSAIQQFLGGNPHLAVEVHPPDAGLDPLVGPAPVREPRTVQIAVLEDPLRLQLEMSGRRRVLDYRGLDDLASLLADLAEPGSVAINPR